MAAPVDGFSRASGLESDDVSGPLKPNKLGSRRSGARDPRQSVLEISRMADEMAALIQEIRNTNVETNKRLRMVEADLNLIALER